MGICFSYRYEGERDWRWRKTGHGTRIHKKSGAKFVGNWRKGKRHGFGTSYYGNDENNAIQYRGIYRRGKCHGPGFWQSKIIENGERDRYTGTFDNDNKHGKGKYVYHDGIVYDGSYKNDKYEGQGSITWPPLGIESKSTFSFAYTSFKGSFINGLKSGDGIFFSTDGYKFKGTYLDDKFEGHGTLIFPDNSKYHGGFYEGKFSGVGKYWYSNGDYYYGNFLEGKLNGDGEMQYADGIHYIGG